MDKFNFSVINLWCNKNLVDTEYVTWEILGNIDKNVEINFFDTPEDKEVEFVLINTCWFLSSSRDEAEKTIKYYNDIGKKIIIIWCYIPVKDDNFISKLDNLYKIIPYKNIESDAKDILKSKIETFNKLKDEKILKYLESIWWDNLWKKAHIWWSKSTRAFFNADYWYEYLKIAEGCDNRCSFCIIPKIRWNQTSRSIEDIIEEVNKMLDNGIKEIEIISQDTTRYWIDLYWESSLIKLLKEIDKIEWEFKIRLFYMYPDILTMDSLEELKKLKKLLPYFDIPFQHISTDILKKMWRFYNESHIHNILGFIKENFPWAFIHTNFIIGFPWETDDDFNKLTSFIKKYEFDSMSIFWYHDEPLAASSKLKDKINDKTISSRLNIIKKIANNIYKDKEKARKNKIEIWYIMDILEDEQTIIIRPELKAPEIDEYDHVKFENIFDDEIYIWKKIEYKIK